MLTPVHHLRVCTPARSVTSSNAKALLPVLIRFRYSREVTLFCEPWVRATDHPIVVLARREGKNTDHAARSVLLKVQP